MSEMDQSIKLRNVCVFNISLLLMYKLENDVKRQGADTLTKTKKIKNS